MRLRFDRGTILFETVTDAAVVESLPGVLWDPRVGTYRGTAFRLREIATALEDGGIEAAVDSIQPLERTGSWTPPMLRPYQESALRAWSTCGRRGVVVLPTGSGKTRLALAAMASTGVSALCLAPTRALVEQWITRIGESYDGEIGCFGDGHRSSAFITVATFESAYRYMPQLGNRFELLVVDEVHHFGRGVRDEALEMSAAPFRLGLTATPDAGAGPRLEQLVGQLVYELGITELAGKYLADFEVISITLDLSDRERREYERDRALYSEPFRRFWRLAPGAGWADLLRTLSRSEEGRLALAAWRRNRRCLALTQSKTETLRTLLDQHAHSRVLVFTADNETAYVVAGTFGVMPITCEIGRKERAECIAAFEQGRLGALVSNRVLNEGIDLPSADVAILVSGSLGDREYVQRVGRLLRPADGKKAIIYDLVSRDTSEVPRARERRKRLVARSARSIPGRG